MKQEILKDKTGTISFIPYVNNQFAVASSATVTVLDNGGTAILSNATATIVAGTGEIYYSISSTYTGTLGENYVAQWTYAISGTTYYQTTLFDIVRNEIAITVVDQDLLDEQADILEKNENFAGAVDSATSTTIVDADLKVYADDWWNGGICKVVNPATGSEQRREISDFTASTGTVTVPDAWGTTPTSSYTFIIYRGFYNKIEKAFEEMLFDVRQKGYRPALIIESSDLKIPHVKKTLAMICRDYITQVGDKWDELSKVYDKQYNDFMGKVQFQYDADESGIVDHKDEQPQVRLRR